MERVNYIVFDMVARKVVFESTDIDKVYDYEHAHGSKVLYLFTIKLDETLPCCRGIKGVAL